MMISKLRKILMTCLLCVLCVCIIGSVSIAYKAKAEGEKTIGEVSLTMENGAYIRMVGDGHNGIRFIMSMSSDDYNGLKNNSAYSEVYFGMFIAPLDCGTDVDDPLNETEVFGDGKIFDWATWDETEEQWVYTPSDLTRIVCINANELAEQADGSYYMYGALTNINDSNIARDFVGRGYCAVKEAGSNEYTYKFADFDDGEVKNNIRSISFVAEKAVAYTGEDALDADEKDYVTETYINVDGMVVDATATSVGNIKSYKTGNAVTMSKDDFGDINRISDGNGTDIPFTVFGENQDRVSIANDFAASLAETLDKSGNITLKAYVKKDDAYKVYTFKVFAYVPETVTTVDQLLAMRLAGDGYYTLAANLDLADNASDLASGATFNGIFDGDGYVLSNLTFNSGNNGFFSTLGGSGEVRNVGFKNVTFGNVQSGTVAKFMSAGAIIDNVCVEYAVGSSNHSGGIVQQVSGAAVITNCTVYCSSATMGTNNGLIVGFSGSNPDNFDITGTVAVKKAASATLVGGRSNSGSYDTFRDAINGLDTSSTPKTFTTLALDLSYVHDLDMLCASTSVFNKVTNKSELLTMRTTSGSGKYYFLTADIDLASTELAYTSVHWSGVLDGNGHIIDNVSLSSASNAAAVGGGGFFRSISGGVVKNVAFTNAKFKLGSSQLSQGGVICSQLKNGAVIDNVYVEADISGTSAAGGIAKHIDDGTSVVTITNCVVKITTNKAVTNGGILISFGNKGNADPAKTILTGTYGIKTYSETKLCGRESSYATFYGWMNGLDGDPNKLVYTQAEFDAAIENSDLDFSDYMPAIKRMVLQEAVALRSASLYKVVIPQNATTNEIAAKDTLVNFYNAATGVTLPVVRDNTLTGYKDDANYLCVGKTSFAVSNGFVPTYEQVNENGYLVKTDNLNVFMVGNSDYGTIYAVHKFLENEFGYDYYAPDNYSVKTGVYHLKTTDYNLTVKPDINTMQSAWGFINYGDRGNYPDYDIMNGYEMMQRKDVIIPINSNPSFHNSLEYFPLTDYLTAHPKFYQNNQNNASTNDICFTAHGDATEFEAMTTIAADKIKAALRANTKLNYMIIGLQDRNITCTCSACESNKSDYGTYSANGIIFCNRVLEKVYDWFDGDGASYKREFYFVLNAYFKLADAPTNLTPVGKTPLTVNDHFGVFIALYGEDFDYTATIEEKPAQYAKFDAWAMASNAIIAYTYDMCYNCFLTPFDSFESKQDLYQKLEEVNCVSIYDLGSHSVTALPTGWALLKIYLESKLRWNVDIDMDAYTQKYFDGVYGAASATMKGIYESYRTYWDDVKAGANNVWQCNLSNVNTSVWNKATLIGWLNDFDTALSDIAALASSDPDEYARISKMIYAERLSVLYLTLELYHNSLTSAELTKYGNAIKADVAATKTVYTNESRSIRIDSRYSEWGIA